MEIRMTNSLTVRLTVAFLILASGIMGWLINEFFYSGDEFLAGICVFTIPAFAIIGARFLRDDETTSRRLRRVRRAY
jgi:hypothetical protein